MPRLAHAALIALLLSAAPALAQGIAVEDPYAITPFPAAPSGAAFMTLRNDAAEPDRLLSATTPVARTAELHTHAEEDGVMRMRPVEGGLEIPANGTLALERGALHVMLMGIDAPLADGVTIPLTLVFENAGEVLVDVPVDRARLTEDAAHHHGEGEAHAHD